MESKARKYLTIIALGLAGGSIYFIPYVKYVFYDAQLAAMGINNTQSGLLLTMYTIGNMVLYIPGGYLADKVSTKKALIISLVATSVLTWVYAFSLNFVVSMIIWLGLSFSNSLCILVSTYESGTNCRNRRRTGIHVWFILRL